MHKDEDTNADLAGDVDHVHPQPWLHGALLPVRVILRDFAARGLPEKGDAVTVEHLWAFLTDELAAEGLDEYAPHLRRTLREKGGMLLFDGLDEVPAAEDENRRAQIVGLVRQVKNAFPKCRVLVTSRTYAYRQQDWALDGFDATVLAPFSQGQMIRFVDRWYAHIATLREMDAEDAQGRAQLLKRAILRNERLYKLAERPLLLTLMASLHAWRGGSLPEKREQLYNDTVDLLLDWWEKRRVVREKDGTVRLMQPSLAEYLNVGKDRLRKLLNELAYEAHAGQPDLQGTADIPEKDLVDGLMHLTDKPDIKPKRLVEYLRDRAGLLIPRGVGVYTFPHRTFQEYLAACHLTDTGYPDEVAKLAKQDPTRWREVCLLAGAKATRGGAFALWPLVDALCPVEPEEHPAEADLWGALLAGQAILENADGGSLSAANEQKQTRVRDWQVAILNSVLPPVERALAGDTLAVLGDPRLEVTTVEGMSFCLIPPGPFRMGRDRYDDEKPAHTNHHLDAPYWISRYPVTVAQWRAYVEASGISFDRWQYNRHPNHPVVSVTWYEARGFCQWLNQTYARALPENYHFDLPSEAEWEKAARGGLKIMEKAIIAALQDGLALPDEYTLVDNPAPQREYPWGDEITPDHANYDETGLGTTSAVGAFPKGASPYGVLDLSGNVWEWTRSLWGTKLSEPDFKYPYDPADGREDLEAPDDTPRVLRGGAFFNYLDLVRAAARLWDPPADRHGSGGFRVVLSPMHSAL